MLRSVLLASPLRGATKRRQQAVRRLIANSLTCADVPRSDSDVTDPLMGLPSNPGQSLPFALRRIASRARQRWPRPSRMPEGVLT